MPDAIPPPGFSLPTWAAATVKVAKTFANDDAAAVSNALAAGQVVDGYTLQTGDVVLAITASPHRNSGLYEVGATQGARHSAANDPAEFVPNMLVTCTQGIWAGKTFRYAGPANPVIGTDPLPFVQFSPIPITPPLVGGAGGSGPGGYLVYWGPATPPTLDGAGIAALSGQTASTSPAGNYSFTPSGEQYFYLAWPDAFSAQPRATDGFVSGGLPMTGDLAGATEGYDQSQNGWPYKLVSIGGNNYRLYRTRYTQSGPATITVNV